MCSIQASATWRGTPTSAHHTLKVLRRPDGTKPIRCSRKSLLFVESEIGSPRREGNTSPAHANGGPVLFCIDPNRVVSRPPLHYTGTAVPYRNISCLRLVGRESRVYLGYWRVWGCIVVRRCLEWVRRFGECDRRRNVRCCKGVKVVHAYRYQRFRFSERWCSGLPSWGGCGSLWVLLDERRSGSGEGCATGG